MGWRVVYQSRDKVEIVLIEKDLSLICECFSARYADDTGHRKFMEEIYEHQYRLIAGAQWQAKAIAWTDLVR